MSKQEGATTTDLRVAVKEAGFKNEKAISRAMAIARDKLEKEGVMPAEMTTEKAPKAKKVRKAKVEHKDEIAQLRTDISSLRKQMKALDASLRKEQSAEKSAKRSKLLKKIAKKSLTLTKKMASVISFPIMHPVVTVAGVGRASFWVGRQFKKSYAWLNTKPPEGTEVFGATA